MKLPYPFMGREAQVLWKDRVPFPPLPGGVELGRMTGKRRRTGQRGGGGGRGG
jgi:hypothetical protein